jgi:hypothetical protein
VASRRSAAKTDAIERDPEGRRPEVQYMA